MHPDTEFDWPSSAIRRAMALIKDVVANKVTIIDVGAHHGELISHLDELPSSIDCISYFGFEPDSRNLDSLIKAVHSASPRVTPEIIPCAVSSESGTKTFYESQSDVVSGLLVPEEDLKTRVPSGDHIIVNTPTVNTVTLDSKFRQSLTIDSINLLKIDTEGHDRDVLLGASSLLDGQLIDIVICEFFSVKYRLGQAYLWDICSYLHNKGFYFDNLYDSRQTSQGRLYTGNLIFVSDRIATANGFL